LLGKHFLINSISNGDFPSPAASGQIFVSTSTASGQFQSTLPTGVTVPTSTLNGNLDATTVTEYWIRTQSSASFNSKETSIPSFYACFLVFSLHYKY
jgi:hypothetical protein